MIVECNNCHLRYDFTAQDRTAQVRCRCGQVVRVPERNGPTQVMNCASCGGGSPADKTHCQYCGNALANMRCAKCMSLQAAGMRHCGRCGTMLTQAARAISGQHAEPRDCPRCRQPLTCQLVADTLIDHCDGCLGLWIEHDALEHLIEVHQNRPTQRFRPTAQPRSEAARKRQRVVYVKCPECAGLMTRRNPATRSGIIVDVCHAHGVWFDHEELAHLLAQVRDGTQRIALVPDPAHMREAEANQISQKILGPHKRADTRLEDKQHWDVLSEGLPEVLNLLDRLF